MLYPSHGWLRFGYQDGAPQERYRIINEESGLPLILFQYPDATKATYSLDTQLEIAAQPGVFATKNGVRNMRRWDTEIPVLRDEHPDLQILTCHDEYLLHTMFDVDGALVGYGGLAPEPLIELIAAGKAKDYAAARAVHDRLLPVTKAVYHRGSHMEGTVALKLGLKARGVLTYGGRSPPAARPAGGRGGGDHPRPQERRAHLTVVPPGLLPAPDHRAHQEPTGGVDQLLDPTQVRHEAPAAPPGINPIPTTSWPYPRRARKL